MPEPLTSAELESARQWAMTYGPANCWTGTSGSAAATILKLLKEIERLKLEKGGER